MHLAERFYSDDELASAGFKHVGINVKIKRSAAILFTENISIGDNSRIDDFTVIVASREPVSIGMHVHIASHCYLSASDGLVMDDFSGLAPGVKIFTSSDDYTGKKMTNPTLPRHLIGGPAGAVSINRHAIIGAGTVILPRVTIKCGTSVGALSLVTNDLDEWGIYCGVPARRIRDRSKDLLQLERKYLDSLAELSESDSKLNS